jgi:dienelactone hydrolase
MRLLFTLMALSLAASAAQAAVQTKTVEYRDGDQVLEGFLAWDDSKAKADGSMQAPGVLIVHQWMGLTDYEKTRARQLAELGYVAFALDIYGQGVRPEGPQEAAKMAGKFKEDRELFRSRLKAGLEQLRQAEATRDDQLAAIGYCFGGTGVLELARSGAEVDGVVSFHGGLDSPDPEDGKNIDAKVLVLHGADDPFVPEKDIDAFKKELNAAGVDWQMVYYSGAVHSFTQPMAGNDKSRGAAYDADADRRSWEAMKDFFEEIFQEAASGEKRAARSERREASGERVAVDAAR